MLRRRTQPSAPSEAGQQTLPGAAGAPSPFTSTAASLLRPGDKAVPSSSALHKRKMEPPSERSGLLPGEEDQHDGQPTDMAWSRRNQWIIFAIASGACAAFNGVFAKLTTTDLTTTLSQNIASLLGLSSAEAAIEFIVRATFFGLNLVFNGVMWTLFTTALARGHSTTQVSIMNTSSNFVLTALLGLAIFSESLPPLWWLGAAMLVAGNVIIGRKDEGSSSVDSGSPDEHSDDSASEAESGRSDYEPVPQVVPPAEKEDEDIPELGDLDAR